ncbi:hypothetical protein R54767_05168 [Paraburkholderia gardini]|uniref:Uncharacterized protein n=1 Tax=Paraburkholderia gardini TaxID=2823469 RepID=A0ABN7QXL1_9BURK|nr:hypothetical protein R54767_05168 [Paraburkholderia gardini]
MFKNSRHTCGDTDRLPSPPVPYSTTRLGDDILLPPRDLGTGSGSARFLGITEPAFCTRSPGNPRVGPRRVELTIDEPTPPFNPVSSCLLFSQPLRLNGHRKSMDDRTRAAAHSHTCDPGAELVRLRSHNDLKLAARNSACWHRFLLSRLHDRHAVRIRCACVSREAMMQQFRHPDSRIFRRNDERPGVFCR